jgi:hypothetical protein
MSAVVTSLDPVSGGVELQWSAPNSNGAAISAYKLEILDSTGIVWSQELVDCDGASLAIISSLQCIIPMPTLWQTPFALASGVLVSVRASAQNLYGWGASSPVNTVGATVLVVPIQMGAPSRGASTTTAQI